MNRLVVLEALYERDCLGERDTFPYAPAGIASCWYCGWRLRFPNDNHLDPRFYASAQIEHVIPRFHGGTDALSNLVLACPPCNREKGTGPYLRQVLNCRRGLVDE